jgi:hypothetical protein
MRVGRMVYWFVTGACLGLGLDTWALGIFFVAGMILVLVGVFAQRGREAAAVVLGLGVGSAALLALVTDTNFQDPLLKIGKITLLVPETQVVR